MSTIAGQGFFRICLLGLLAASANSVASAATITISDNTFNPDMNWTIATNTPAVSHIGGQTTGTASLGFTIAHVNHMVLGDVLSVQAQKTGVTTGTWNWDFGLVYEGGSFNPGTAGAIDDISYSVAQDRWSGIATNPSFAFRFIAGSGWEILSC